MREREREGGRERERETAYDKKSFGVNTNKWKRER
jgi:hypothetical protein